MSARMPRRVVVTDSEQLLAPGIERLRAAGIDVEVMPAGATAEETADRASHAPVLVVGVMPFRAAAIARLASTRLIIRAGIGYDIVDVPAATAARITVANVPDYCVDEVADHALMLLLATSRRLPEIAPLWHTHDRWVVNDLLPPVHRIRRLGVIGLGRIGRAVATRGAGFGWDVVATDPFVTPGTDPDGVARMVGLDELLATSDAVTLHCPLTDETRGLLDDRRLALLPRGAVVVNTSRGGLVDLDALERAIETGQVAAAAIDVLDREPAPDLSHPLLHRSEVIVTPHIAWYSLEAKRELALRTADEVLRYLDEGVVRHRVNPDVVPRG